jgi:hypothetical protein
MAETIVLTKTQSCDQLKVCETVTVTEQTAFVSSGNAEFTVIPPGGSPSKPVTVTSQYIAKIPGEYTLCLSGNCKSGEVCASPVLPMPTSLETSCEEPVNVNICNPTPDVEKIHYCNTDTNTQWLKVCVYSFDEDGTPVETILSDQDTGFACGQGLPVYDIEKYEYCNPDTGTKWLKVCRYVTIEGVTVEEEISNVDLGFPCADPIVVEKSYCVI